MFYLIVFLLVISSPLHQTLKCSTNIPIHHQYAYLCREKLNSTTLRIWLHWRFNRTLHHRTSLAFYRFTLRTIDLVHEKKFSFEDRFERTISETSSLDFDQTENHTIIIHNLHPGRYEICVYFLNQKQTIFYRTLDSCLQVPWYVSENGADKPNLLLQVLLMISIILLLSTIAFVTYAFHRLIQSCRTSPVIVDARDNDEDDEERARSFVHRHFVQDARPYEALVFKRIHQRYAHRSPEFD